MNMIQWLDERHSRPTINCRIASFLEIPYRQDDVLRTMQNFG